nr:DNA/RNA helicase, DEAD/DEAH box type, N-terminal [Tanacetum cinerariifolium]
MTLEVVYQEVDKIKAESTVIQVEEKTFDSVKQLKNDLLDMFSPHFLRSSRSVDHQRSMHDSPKYDRRDGRVVSRRYSDDRDYRDRSKPLPRHRRDYKH